MANKIKKSKCIIIYIESQIHERQESKHWCYKTFNPDDSWVDFCQHLCNGDVKLIPHPQGTSLLQSLTHELGHSLGLLHSSNSKAMMAPYHRVAHKWEDFLPIHQGWDPNLSLHRDDIEAIEALYGSTTQTGRRRGGGRFETQLTLVIWSHLKCFGEC